MKKLVLALTALAAFTGSAMAADMAPRTYAKAPAPMAMAPSWTGFYIFGGGGGGLWAADSDDPEHGYRRLPPLQSISVRVDPVGSERSAPDTTGSSTAAGCAAFSPTASSAASVARIQDPRTLRRGNREDAGQPGRLACGSAISSLRMSSPTSMAATSGSQWSGTSLVNTVSGASAGPVSAARQRIYSQWLLHWRRCREQPEHLRHQRLPAGS